MSGEWLFTINIWLIFAGALLILILAELTGYWLGRQAALKRKVEQDASLSTVQGAILGLLALLLAFSVSMASTRYETRKQFVVDEANAIGTTYLRAQQLPDPYRAQASQQLREYVALRLELVRAGEDRQAINDVNNRTSQLQRQLWLQAIQISQMDARSVTAGLYIQSLNQMIDLHAKRSAALANHVPVTIIALLVIVAIFTIGLLGYGAGLARVRRLLSTSLVVLLIATILTVMIDLDRPRSGLITIGQQSMLDAQELLNEDFSP